MSPRSCLGGRLWLIWLRGERKGSNEWCVDGGLCVYMTPWLPKSLTTKDLFALVDLTKALASDCNGGN